MGVTPIAARESVVKYQMAIKEEQVRHFRLKIIFTKPNTNKLIFYSIRDVFDLTGFNCNIIFQNELEMSGWYKFLDLKVLQPVSKV
jgi:hypothetical protein